MTFTKHLIFYITIFISHPRSKKRTKGETRERKIKIFQFNKNSPFLRTFWRCISFRLAEACGSNNHKPFEHFSPTFYCFERRSQFRSGQDFHLMIAASKLLLQNVFSELKIHKHLFILASTWHEQNTPGYTYTFKHLSDVAHRLLLLTAIWCIWVTRTYLRISDKQNDWFLTVMNMGLWGIQGWRVHMG